MKTSASVKHAQRGRAWLASFVLHGPLRRGRVMQAQRARPRERCQVSNVVFFLFIRNASTRYRSASRASPTEHAKYMRLQNRHRLSLARRSEPGGGTKGFPCFEEIDRRTAWKRQAPRGRLPSEHADAPSTFATGLPVFLSARVF